MDTVEGKKGGKILLTMLFRNSKLMIAFLLNDKTSNSVLKVFNWIESILGNDLFEKTFPVILTYLYIKNQSKKRKFRLFNGLFS